MAVVAAVLAILPGCGHGGGGGGSSSPSPPPSSSAAVTPAVTATTGPLTVDTTFTGQGSAAYCQLSKSYADAAARLGPNPDAQLRQAYEDAARDMQAAVAVAPAEIKGDAQIVADGFGGLIAALQGVDYDFTRLPPDVVARFMDDDFRRASIRLTAYGKNICHQ